MLNDNVIGHILGLCWAIISWGIYWGYVRVYYNRVYVGVMLGYNIGIMEENMAATILCCGCRLGGPPHPVKVTNVQRIMVIILGSFRIPRWGV